MISNIYHVFQFSDFPRLYFLMLYMFTVHQRTKDCPFSDGVGRCFCINIWLLDIYLVGIDNVEM